MYLIFFFLFLLLSPDANKPLFFPILFSPCFSLSFLPSTWTVNTPPVILTPKTSFSLGGKRVFLNQDRTLYTKMK